MSEGQALFLFGAEFIITAITAITCSTIWGTHKHSDYVWETVSHPFQSGDYNHSYHCSHLQPTLWNRQVQWICLTVSVPFQSRVYDHCNHRCHLQHILWNRKAWWMCLRDSLPSFSEQSLQSPAAQPLKQTTVNMSERVFPLLQSRVYNHHVSE